MSEIPAKPTGLINRSLPQDEDDKSPLGADLTGLPTIYSDTYWLTWWRGHIKITFGEKIRGQGYYRASILMEASDLKVLITDLQEALEKLAAKEKK